MNNAYSIHNENEENGGKTHHIRVHGSRIVYNDDGSNNNSVIPLLYPTPPVQQFNIYLAI